MDYTARKKELMVLRNSITAKEISTNNVSTFNDTITNWDGVSASGYTELIQDTKEFVQLLYQTKADVLEAIDQRISVLETAIDNQYTKYKGIPYRTYDDDTAENKKAQRKAINAIPSLDSSVRTRLLNLI